MDSDLVFAYLLSFVGFLLFLRVIYLFDEES